MIDRRRPPIEVEAWKRAARPGYKVVLPHNALYPTEDRTEDQNSYYSMMVRGFYMLAYRVEEITMRQDGCGGLGVFDTASNARDFVRYLNVHRMNCGAKPIPWVIFPCLYIPSDIEEFFLAGVRKILQEVPPMGTLFAEMVMLTRRTTDDEIGEQKG